MSDLEWIKNFPPELIGLILEYIDTEYLYKFQDGELKWISKYPWMMEFINQEVSRRSRHAVEYHDSFELDGLLCKTDLKGLGVLWKELFPLPDERAALIEMVSSQIFNSASQLGEFLFFTPVFQGLELNRYEMASVMRNFDPGEDDEVVEYFKSLDKELVMYLLFEGIQPIGRAAFQWDMGMRVACGYDVFGMRVFRARWNREVKKPCPWHSQHLPDTPCPYILTNDLEMFDLKIPTQVSPQPIPPKTAEEIIVQHDWFSVMTSFPTIAERWPHLSTFQRWAVISMVGNVMEWLDDPIPEDISRVLNQFLDLNISKSQLSVLLYSIQPTRLQDLNSLLQHYTRDQVYKLLCKDNVGNPQAQNFWQLIISELEPNQYLEECWRLKRLNLKLRIPGDVAMTLIMQQYQQDVTLCEEFCRWLYASPTSIMALALCELANHDVEKVHETIVNMAGNGDTIKDWPFLLLREYAESEMVEVDELIEVARSFSWSKLACYEIVYTWVTKTCQEDVILEFVEMIESFEFEQQDWPALILVIMKSFPTYLDISMDEMWKRVDQWMENDEKFEGWILLIKALTYGNDEWYDLMRLVFLQQFRCKARGDFISKTLSLFVLDWKNLIECLQEFCQDEILQSGKSWEKFVFVRNVLLHFRRVHSRGRVPKIVGQFLSKFGDYPSPF